MHVPICRFPYSIWTKPYTAVSCYVICIHFLPLFIAFILLYCYAVSLGSPLNNIFRLSLIQHVYFTSFVYICCCTFFLYICWYYIFGLKSVERNIYIKIRLNFHIAHSSTMCSNPACLSLSCTRGSFVKLLVRSVDQVCIFNPSY